MIWPDGKQFAFTIFDDTDLATAENLIEVYAFLADLGFRTTKSVWPLKGDKESINMGATCEDPHYLDWLYRLKEGGSEIGYHLATYHTSNRAETIAGLDKFAGLFGTNPSSMSNHAGCEESIYWGSYRLTGANQLLYNLLTRYRSTDRFRGHIEGDSLFWGDLCKERIKYTRNFVFPEINTLKACPFMPYHDPKRPFVNYWFASTEGPEISSFNKIIAEENQNRLQEEGGACIMYTHLAQGFYYPDGLNRRFKILMQQISKRNGWFVPVNELLDYLLEKNGHYVISKKEMMRLERKWLWHKICHGSS